MTSERRIMIEARELGKTYLSGGRPLHVLRGVELIIREEEVVAIVGPSGSGKTTLLGLLAGLDTPSTGSVSLGGQDLSLLDEDGRADLRAEQVGFVFQSFHLLPTLTALENVLVPMELQARRVPARTMRERARELLDRVGLGDRMEHYPTQLSGGERQRVALARAFSIRPRILFADEPTGNLDAETGEKVVSILEELNRESRTTLILVTHDAGLAGRAGRIVRLAGGQVVEEIEQGQPRLAAAPGAL